MLFDLINAVNSHNKSSTSMNTVLLEELLGFFFFFSLFTPLLFAKARNSSFFVGTGEACFSCTYRGVARRWL